MQLLLTSGGVTNPTIRAALVDLLGKPIEESRALAIATAQYGHPWTTPWTAWDFISGTGDGSVVGLGWETVGFLEVLALADMPRERWQPWLDETDALLVDGGSAAHLQRAIRACGLDVALADRKALVWVGVSAGSMVLTPRIGTDFLVRTTEDESDAMLALTEAAIFPHLNHPDMPTNTLAAAEAWAAKLDCRAYALDDASALVDDGHGVRVVTEGTAVLLRDA